MTTVVVVHGATVSTYPVRRLRAMLRHEYTPRGACADLWGERGSEVLVSGPAGTGKSRACLEKLLLMAVLNPHMRGLIVRKTLASLGSTALVTWREKVIVDLTPSDCYYFGGSSQEPPQYRFSNGSTITIGGMDKSTKIMSSEYDVIYVQEATELTENDWEALTTRLRNGRISFQQLIADCNPDMPTHWLKARADKGITRLLESVHEDNPTLFNEDGTVTETGKDYIDKLDRLTGVRFLRLRKGIWAAAEGLVYEEWNANAHLIDRFAIPESWPRYWCIDFGFRNPFVCQWWAEDPDGKLILYREIYHTNKTVEQHAKDILAIMRDKDGNWTEPLPNAIICDHDAEGKAVLEEKLGLGTQNAHKSVKEGIQATQDRFADCSIALMRDSVVTVDPALRDSGRPTCTQEEIVGYVWRMGPNGRILEEPLKENDHGMDAKRYMVAEKDLKAKPRVRFM
jgi:PBSX family phage terminase large subunit